MTEGWKIILKPEMPLMSRMMSEKQSVGEGNAQKSSITKWKWFIQHHATCGMQGSCTHKRGAFFPLGLTLKLCEEPQDSVITWTVPYKQFSTDQQRAAWFMDGSCKVNG